MAEDIHLPSSVPPSDPNNPNQYLSEAKLQQVSARVPESVARGVFSTGAIVLAGPSELILDFVSQLTQPHQVVARVVLPLNVTPAVIHTLRDNLEKYSARFGPPQELPKPQPNDRRPTLQEVYDDLRLPDTMLGGTYSNGLIVGHSPAEFALDFLASMFPRSVVSARIYLAAPHIPRLLESLSATYEQHMKRIAAAQQQQQKPQPPAPGSEPGRPGPVAPGSTGPGTSFPDVSDNNKSDAPPGDPTSPQ